ncbi:mitochondrial PGP phosphatase-domain-containing protein [Chytriomyces sp. MP71]|nr:mitochondrial PGP phosphatase-domain-containing protein [Chytriomyces sp. MP71]
MQGQSWNAKGVGGVLRVALRPSLAVPQLSVASVASLDFGKLKRAGVRVLAFDKDNTLTAPYALGIHPPLLAAWEQCLGQFGRDNVVIVSNSAGSADDAGGLEADRIERALGVKVLRHTEKKPGGARFLLAHFNAFEPAQMAVVGDRLLTDIVYANALGAVSIHTTQIITEQGDNPFARILRRVENRFLLPLLRGCGVRPPPHPFFSSAAFSREGNEK